MRRMGQEVTAVDRDYDEHFFDAGDGLRLFFRRWFVPGAKGLAAIVHGFAEHSGRYKHVVDFLCEAGWSVATFDCRGHGQSGGRRAHVDHFQDYLDDTRAFLQEVKKAGFQGLPVLLGHSQGGLIAARFVPMLPDSVAGLVLSSPFIGLAMKVPAFKALAGKAVSKIFPTLAMKTGLDPAVLSHDRDVVEKYAADPLVSNIATARWFTEIQQAHQDALRQAGGIRCPLLMLLAGDDRVTSTPASRNLFEAAGSADKILKEYPDYYHEVFNEVGRDRVLADLRSWLESHRQ
jgi:alpha-beta hydrolase superfamily lysophospholipase